MYSAHLDVCHRTRWCTKNGTPTGNGVYVHLNITVTYTYVQFVTKFVYFCKMTYYKILGVKPATF